VLTQLLSYREYLPETCSESPLRIALQGCPIISPVGQPYIYVSGLFVTETGHFATSVGLALFARIFYEPLRAC